METSAKTAANVEEVRFLICIFDIEDLSLFEYFHDTVFCFRHSLTQLRKFTRKSRRECLI